MPPKPKSTTPALNWSPQKASARALANFEERFSSSIGLPISKGEKIKPYEVIPTGSLVLDRALRIGGYPVGRMIELWGREAAGKTTLAMLATASAQRTFPDKMAAWVDMEQSFDPAWATSLGVDMDRLMLVTPHTAEDLADAGKQFVASGYFSLVTLDSIGAMISRTEFEKESDEQTVAIVARIVTRLVKQCSAMGAANGTTTLLINQVRNTINSYGGSQTQPGGNARRHAVSILAKVSRGNSDPKKISVAGEPTPVPVGYEVSVKIEKSKVAPYGSVANFWLFHTATKKYGPIGVDQASEAADFGLTSPLIETKGAWYTVPGGERFNGKPALTEYLRTNPELMKAIREHVIGEAKREPVEGQPDDEPFTVDTDLDAL